MGEGGPLGSRAARWLWVALAVGACVLQGPAFVEDLRPKRTKIVDFFGEWASAKNYFAGLPIYTDHDTTLARYLNDQRPPGATVFNARNGHPPAAVLPALPLAFLDYPDALLAWNLASLAALAGSLWLVARQLSVRVTPWSVFPLVALGLVCNPLREQLAQGQLNLFLLILIVGAWAADRSGRPFLAGACIGLATAIKLFPGFLLLYFLARRQWRALAASAAALAAVTALTLALFGVEAHRDYLNGGVATAAIGRGIWMNASLPGLWTKLFDPTKDEPLLASPALAWVATAVSSLVVTAVVARAAWRATDRRGADEAFALAVTGMMLVSPVTWWHAFVLLLLPLAVLWLWLPRGAGRWALYGLAACFWVPPFWLYKAAPPDVWTAGRARLWQTLTAISLQCYALVGLFVLGALVLRRQGPAEEAEGEGAKR